MPLLPPDAEAVQAFTAAFREATGYAGDVGSFAFGDSPEMADELGRLVLHGPKRATARLDEPDEPAPVVGQHDVVLAGDGTPLCLVRTTEVRTVPFREVDPAFAWDEGEGDRTLAWWREAHVRFFARAARPRGTFDDDRVVHLERFELVWPEVDPPPPLVEAGGVTVRAVRPDDRGWVRHVTGDLADDEGWRTDQLPGLLARRDLRTAGVLVFRPHQKGDGATRIVAIALLDEDPDVQVALRDALDRLARRHRWAHPKG